MNPDILSRLFAAQQEPQWGPNPYARPYAGNSQEQPAPQPRRPPPAMAQAQPQAQPEGPDMWDERAPQNPPADLWDDGQPFPESATAAPEPDTWNGPTQVMETQPAGPEPGPQITGAPLGEMFGPPEPSLSLEQAPGELWANQGAPPYDPGHHMGADDANWFADIYEEGDPNYDDMMPQVNDALKYHGQKAWPPGVDFGVEAPPAQPPLQQMFTPSTARMTSR